MLTIKYVTNLDSYELFDYWYRSGMTDTTNVPDNAVIKVDKLNGLDGSLQDFNKFVRKLNKDNNYTLIMDEGQRANGKMVQFMAHKIYLDGELIKGVQQEMIKDFDSFEKVGDKYLVKEPMFFEIGKKNFDFGGKTCNNLINQGFVFDISAPKLIRKLVDNQPTRVAACLHDFCIRQGLEPKFRDQVFYDALRNCGASFIYSNVLWAAVRVYSLTPKSIREMRII